MKNLNTILILLGVMFFVAFFASNSLAEPYIFFLWTNVWAMWIVYATLVWIVMWWALKWMMTWKNSSDYDWDDWEWF